MFLVRLQHDVSGLGVILERWVEELLLDRLVDLELIFELGEDGFTGLDRPLGGRFELGQHLLHLHVVLLQQPQCVHRSCPPDPVGGTIGRGDTRRGA